MSSSERLKNLAARKALLVTRADLHRELIAFERLQLHGYHEAARGVIERNRWWLVGGTIVGGLLLARSRRGLAGWAPIVIAAVQAWKK